MDLLTVQQIERAIDALTPEQREELYVWLDERYLHVGDAQLKLRSRPVASMTAFPALLPIIKLEERNHFSAGQLDAPRQHGFLERVSGVARSIRERADKQFALLRANPRHPSLQFKKLSERSGQELWSARVTLKYRALAVKLNDDYVWFWVGEHDIYEG